MKKCPLLRGDFVNAHFQGFFDLKTLHQEQTLKGTGVLIDDQFNFFIGHWIDSQLNGMALIRLTSGAVIYGTFKHNKPTGGIVILTNEFQLYLQASGSISGSEYQERAVLMDRHSQILYVIELVLRSQQSELDLEKTQEIGKSNQSTPSQSKSRYKVKILDRLQLRSDGHLLGHSKYHKTTQQQSNYNSNNYSIRQQNILKLIANIMNTYQKEVYLVDLYKFIGQMVERNSEINVQTLGEGRQLFVSVRFSLYSGGVRPHQHLGMIVDSKGRGVSVGGYNQDGDLNGLAIQQTKKGDSYCGIFRNNMLSKEYSHASALTPKSVITIQLRQILYNAHLKSLNYVNTCHYMTELDGLMRISQRVNRYVEVFEKEYEKRHLSYHDTEVFWEGSEDHGNFMKYVEQEHAQEDNCLEEEVKKEENKRVGRVGFIVANRSKSPRERPSVPSVSPKKSPSGRLVGRIVDREVNGKSEGSRGSRGANGAREGQYGRGGAMKGMQIRGYLGRRQAS